MVAFCGLQLAHPIVNGSGTFDLIAARRAFGDVVLGAPGAAGGGSEIPFSAYVSKTITLAPRVGNPPPRLWESPAGMVNSIGLPNKGVAAYLAEDLPQYAALPVPLITNVMGATGEELAEVTAAVGGRPEIAAIELNVSCPNVATGLDIGAVPAELEAVVRHVRSVTTKPLIVKLTPNTADVSLCAQAAEAAGADAVSLINTLRAAPLHPDGGGGRWLGGRQGGLSGPAIRVVALAQVTAVAERVALPIIGMGGVQCGRHARDLLSAGATLVAVGTESFRDPAAGSRVARELTTLCGAGHPGSPDRFPGHED